jgi:hypothetical protein
MDGTGNHHAEQVNHTWKNKYDVFSHMQDLDKKGHGS